jgi:hypothetical protein
MHTILRAAVLIVGLAVLAPAAAGQDKVRSHPRLKKDNPEGQRYKLAIGTLFLPKELKREGTVPLFIHFHGANWVPELAAAQHGKTAVISVQLGTGSTAYGQPFEDAKAFGNMLGEAEKKAGVKFGPITLTAWSAGYGAVRAILRHGDDYDRVQTVILLDGIHAGYVKDSGAKGSAKLVPGDLDSFVKFAKDAAAGKKRFVVTHTQIVPGSYASTTECADYLLEQLKVERKESKKVGPMLTQQLSEAKQGNFLVLGYEGNEAADHVDLLHALPDYLKQWHAVE